MESNEQLDEIMKCPKEAIAQVLSLSLIHI